MSLNEQITGTVFDIQRFSVHDGPGIRTIVFLKGCPLRCRWCSNPESHDWTRQLAFIKRDCIQCNKCVEACNYDALQIIPSFDVKKDQCVLCGDCASVCYPGALAMEGNIVTVPDLIKELRRDSNHYRRSNGGVTLSGGEAIAQADFSAELLKACKREGWHTAVETAAYVPQEKFEKTLPYIDLVLLDIKHADSKKHELFVGKPNELILENAQFIASFPSTELIIRVPLIPSFNDQPEEILAIANIASHLPGVKHIHLLPYHRMGENKYGYLNYEYRMGDIKPPNPDDVSQLKALVEKHTSLICQIGG